MIRPINSIFQAAWIFPLLLALAGCRDQEKSPAKLPPRETKPNDAMPIFKDGRTPPFTYLWGVKFTHQFTAPKPIHPKADYAIEFLPIIQGDTQGKARVEVMVIEGSKEISAGSFAPYLARDSERATSDPAELFSHWAKLDLAPYAGKEIQLKWVLHQAPPEATAIIGSFAIYRRKEPNPARPNILMICSDAHRYDYSIDGRGKELMPRLQGFAASGMNYVHTSSNATWTLPSITSVFTGRFPQYHLTGKRTDTLREDESPTPPKVRRGAFCINWGQVYREFLAFPPIPTLGDILQSQGYFSATITSNVFFIYPGMYQRGQHLVVDERYLMGDSINRAALSFIKNVPKDQPLLLSVHYLDVHQYRDWYLQKKEGKDVYPYTIDRKKIIENYEEAVRDCDRYLGELLDAWDKEIGLKDSLVIFFSDHGDHLRDPGYEGTFDLSKPSEEPYHLDLPLLDHGNSMDEILLHVPLVIHYPEAWGLKGVSEEQVSLVDLFPTILDGLKIAPVAPGNSITSSALHLDGRSLLHPIKDGSPPFIHADYQLYGDEMSSVRQGPFNYVINHHNGDQYLIDTRLPLDGKAEPASRVSNPEMQTRLEEEYKRYEAAAKAATKDLRSDVDIDQSEMTSELEKSGYFAGKSGGIQTPTASPKN